MRVVAVLYPGGAAARSTPELLGCVENALGLRPILEANGHELRRDGRDRRRARPAAPGDGGPDRDAVLAGLHHEGADRQGAEAQAPPHGGGRLGPFRPGRRRRARDHRGRDHGQQRRQCGRARRHADPRARAQLHPLLPGRRRGRLGHRRRSPLGRTTSRTRPSGSSGWVGSASGSPRGSGRSTSGCTTTTTGGSRRPRRRSSALATCPLDALLPVCDVISINAPLTPATDRLFNRERLARMKRGAYLVNTARGRIVDTDALVEALKSGHFAGYAGDVWYPQPAPKDHPWRSMPNHAMTPHVSGYHPRGPEAVRRGDPGLSRAVPRRAAARPGLPDRRPRQGRQSLGTATPTDPPRPRCPSAAGASGLTRLGAPSVRIDHRHT